MGFDKFSMLDDAKWQRDFEALHGPTFNRFSILDPAYGVSQIEQKLGREISNAALLDPMRLTQEVLGTGGGGAGIPAWVPANAKIHIDLIAPGRAWVDGTGEVAVNTLLGSDPNTEEGWGASGYDPSRITANGYVCDGALSPALIGSALARLLSAATVVVRLDFMAAATMTPFVALSADGNDAIDFDIRGNPFVDADVSSWGGSFHSNISGVVNLPGVNCAAFTITGSRFDIAVNGSAAVAGALASDDRPSGNPLVAAVVDASTGNAIQSITIYDPLPNTTGLSELSKISPSG